MSVFSERFCTRRKELNLTQQEIAEKLNVGYRTVSHWENGSYPDGELLPKIAEVLGVSLDYLFGRNNSFSSIEQELLNHFQNETDIKSKESSENFFSKVFDILWAIQISWQKGNTTYWKDEKVDYKKASVFFLEKGFSFLQHKTGSRFYCLCEKPENGYNAIFENTTESSKLLKFLSEQENQKILISLFSLGITEYIFIPVFYAQTGID
jgi:transcriptional regulator with XRE-family HTH domain